MLTDHGSIGCRACTGQHLGKSLLVGPHRGEEYSTVTFKDLVRGQTDSSTSLLVAMWF